MKFITFILSSLFIVLFCFSVQAKVTKKDSLYTGKPIIEKETMVNAGSWWLLMNQCKGGFSKKWRQDLARASWSDYRNFNVGVAKYAEGYQVRTCDPKEADEIAEWYSSILRYIVQEVYKITGSKIENNEPNEKNENITLSENENSDDIEIKLQKLKTLFDKGLITEDEYNAKRKEILDTM